MKILKRPKFKKITCRVCGCVFVPSDKDIEPRVRGYEENRPEVDGLGSRCPVCRASCPAEPKKLPAVKTPQRGGDE